jgi:hypothetical protein
VYAIRSLVVLDAAVAKAPHRQRRDVFGLLKLFLDPGIAPLGIVIGDVLRSLEVGLERGRAPIARESTDVGGAAKPSPAESSPRDWALSLLIIRLSELDRRDRTKRSEKPPAVKPPN